MEDIMFIRLFLNAGLALVAVLAVSALATAEETVIEKQTVETVPAVHEHVVEQHTVTEEHPVVEQRTVVTEHPAVQQRTVVTEEHPVVEQRSKTVTTTTHTED
jgi:hypothetical protein